MEKVELPLKTKIVAWTIIILVGLKELFLLWAMQDTFNNNIVSYAPLFMLLLIILPIVLLGFISVVLLFKKKKLGWWLSLIYSITFTFLLKSNYGQQIICNILSSSFYSKSSFCYIDPERGQEFLKGEFLYLIVFFVILLFLLLLLDRKNFWKIAQ